MATNYPGSLDSYTTKVDNTDDVLAAHVNDLQAAVLALETKLGITNSATSNTIDYFLKHATGAFRTHIHDGTSDDGPALPMSSLSEVSISGVANGQVLQYDSGTSLWKNSYVNLSELNDVQLSTLSSGEALIYNAIAAKWVNQSLATYALLAANQTFTGLNIFAGGFVVENKTSDPVSPVAGQMWFRTDI